MPDSDAGQTPEKAVKPEGAAEQVHGSEIGAPQADAGEGTQVSEDRGRRGVRVGDAWTANRTAERVEVIGVTGSGDAVVVDEEGNRLEISADVLNEAYRHDGEAVQGHRAGFRKPVEDRLQGE